MIKNISDIATTDLRKKLIDITEAGFRKIHPNRLMENAISYDETFNSLIVQNNSYDIIRGRIFVVGGGKASGLMAKKLEEIIGADNITAGVINSIDDNYNTDKIKVIKASHPLPDKKGVKGVEKMLELKSEYEIGEKDLVICLISGGGSSLLPCPAEGVKLEDKQAVTQLLLESGADIKEINIVRKHLSKIKGGRLGKHFSPAKVVSIIISDVIGNDLDAIASGPAAPDNTTFLMALDVLTRHNMLDKVPPSTRAYLEAGCRGEFEETPDELDNCDHYIIGDVGVAMEAMTLKAKTLNLRPLIVTSELAGSTEKAAEVNAGRIIGGEYKDYDVLFFGGETTPQLPENYGSGGRNQHYAAATMQAMETCDEPWAMISIATDGVDYLKGVSGAIIDNESLALAEKEGIDYDDLINKYDTNTLFKEMGNTLVITGDTGTNVGDIVIYIFNKIKKKYGRNKKIKRRGQEKSIKKS